MAASRLFEIKCTIQGTQPLMLNRFITPETPTSREGRAHPNDERGPVEIAEEKLHVGVTPELKGVPVVPTTMLFATLIEAGKYFKVGKKQVSTLQTSMLPGEMEIKEDEVKIEHEEPWQVDERAVKTSVGSRIMAYRPKFFDWKLTFTLELDTEIISRQLMRKIVDCAGRRVGLGEWRPARKGMYGKFVVGCWEESEVKPDTVLAEAAG